MVKAESDAMVSMSNTIQLEGKMEGGILKGIGRMLAGEKILFSVLYARSGPEKFYWHLQLQVGYRMSILTDLTAFVCRRTVF
jgi:uncharacterized protein (AIM24 family)